MTANYVAISVLLTQSLSSDEIFLYMFWLCSDDTMKGTDVNKPNISIFYKNYLLFFTHADCLSDNTMGRVSWKECKAQSYPSPDSFILHLSPGRFIHFLRKSDFDSLLYVKILKHTTSSNCLLPILRASTMIFSCIPLMIRIHTDISTFICVYSQTVLPEQFFARSTPYLSRTHDGTSQNFTSRNRGKKLYIVINVLSI
jgi:hypothetical protein